jgi:protein-tyrosine sulfotransferase
MNKLAISNLKHVIGRNWIDTPPVFIVGCPRSGTTLLRLMLTEHPDVFISSEGAYIAVLRQRVPSQAPGLPTEHLADLHRMVVPFLEREKFICIPSCRDLVEWTSYYGSDLRSLITFYGTFEAIASGRQSLSWWGDNAPYHALHVPFFATLFPNSKFVFMIRDPRDVLASVKTSFPDRSIISVIAEWQEVLLAKFLAQQNMGISRVYELRYEDLVEAPERELRRVCGFLDIDMLPQMLHFHQGKPAKAIAELSHHTNVTRPVFSESVNRGLRVLTEDEIRMIEGHLCTPMKSLGYLSEQAYEVLSRARLIKRVLPQ